MGQDYLLVVIDGTGATDWDQYRKDFKFSFLRQIADGNSNVKYYEGPSVSGQDLLTRIVYPAVRYIKDFVDENPRAPIMLAGYSRGGAGVMEVAKIVSLMYRKNPFKIKRPIPIKEMMLLDPVSKWDGCPGGVAPNVERVFAMFRDQSIVHVSPWIMPGEQVSWWDKAAVVGFAFKDKDRYARRFMGNASVSSIGSGMNTKRWINGDGIILGASHGALGGLPWPERLEDKDAVEKVVSRLNQWLNLCKVNSPVSNKVIFNTDAKSDKDIAEEARFQDFAYHENARRGRMPLRPGEARWPMVSKQDRMWLDVKANYPLPDE